MQPCIRHRIQYMDAKCPLCAQEGVYVESELQIFKQTDFYCSNKIYLVSWFLPAETTTQEESTTLHKDNQYKDYRSEYRLNVNPEHKYTEEVSLSKYKLCPMEVIDQLCSIQGNMLCYLGTPMMSLTLSNSHQWVLVPITYGVEIPFINNIFIKGPNFELNWNKRLDVQKTSMQYYVKFPNGENITPQTMIFTIFTMEDFLNLPYMEDFNPQKILINGAGKYISDNWFTIHPDMYLEIYGKNRSYINNLHIKKKFGNVDTDKVGLQIPELQPPAYS